MDVGNTKPYKYFQIQVNSSKPSINLFTLLKGAVHASKLLASHVPFFTVDVQNADPILRYSFSFSSHELLVHASARLLTVKLVLGDLLSSLSLPVRSGNLNNCSLVLVLCYHQQPRVFAVIHTTSLCTLFVRIHIQSAH